ncbi:cobalamin biosynthesis protein CbiL [Desulfocurvus sp. DL9XJH121]
MHHFHARSCAALCVLLWAFLLLASPASAHRANIFAWEEGGQIKMECSFSGGKPAKNAPISVEDAATDKELLVVETNGQGEASFPVPEAARAARLDLRLVLHAGEGHQGEWVIKADEYLGQTEGAEAPAPEAAPAAEAEKPGSGRTAAVDEAALTRIVDQALDKRLGPINRRLAALSEPGPSASDVFGGIGYILGLFGVAALVRARR